MLPAGRLKLTVFLLLLVPEVACTNNDQDDQNEDKDNPPGEARFSRHEMNGTFLKFIFEFGFSLRTAVLFLVEGS